MNAITLQLNDDLRRKAEAIAAEQGIDVETLLAQMAEAAIGEHDVEKQFRERAARGRGREAEALALLNKD
jgi:hypothetical protein